MGGGEVDKFETNKLFSLVKPMLRQQPVLYFFLSSCSINLPSSEPLGTK